MPVNIAIIGLGQIGTSIGLALGAHKDKIRRIGHDKDPLAGQKARQLGAVDSVDFNLPHSVEGADLILLALPMMEIYQTLPIIAPDIKPDAVVMDTAPLKAPVAAWARTHLQPGRHYVGLVPALGVPAVWESAEPRADLFHKGTIGIVSPQGTPGEAVKLAADLAELLGGQPLFLDMAEADGLMTKIHLMPQFLAAALVNATVDQPGWMEARRLAGRPYDQVGSALRAADFPLEFESTENWQNLLRELNQVIAELTAMSDRISQNARHNSLPINTDLRSAAEKLEKWQKQRGAADWEAAQRPEASQPVGFFERFFGARREK